MRPKVRHTKQNDNKKSVTCAVMNHKQAALFSSPSPSSSPLLLLFFLFLLDIIITLRLSNSTSLPVVAAAGLHARGAPSAPPPPTMTRGRQQRANEATAAQTPIQQGNAREHVKRSAGQHRTRARRPGGHGAATWPGQRAPWPPQPPRRPPLAPHLRPGVPRRVASTPARKHTKDQTANKQVGGSAGEPCPRSHCAGRGERRHGGVTYRQPRRDMRVQARRRRRALLGGGKNSRRQT